MTWMMDNARLLSASDEPIDMGSRRIRCYVDSFPRIRNPAVCKRLMRVSVVVTSGDFHYQDCASHDVGEPYSL
jgi:hypothetical protein